MLRARARGSAAGEGPLRLRTGRCVYPRMLLNLFDAGVGLRSVLLTCSIIFICIFN